MVFTVSCIMLALTLTLGFAAQAYESSLIARRQRPVAADDIDYSGPDTETMCCQS